MLSREPRSPDETEDEFLKREEEALAAIAQSNAAFQSVRDNIAAQFGRGRPKYRDIVTKGRRL